MAELSDRPMASILGGKRHSSFKRELQSFPRGRNDDQVDSFSQFLNWSKGNGFYRALGREHPINVARREQNQTRVRRR